MCGRLLGHRLRRARKEAGLRLVDVAAELGRTEGNISQWEGGHRLIPLEALTHLMLRTYSRGNVAADRRALDAAEQLRDQVLHWRNYWTDLGTDLPADLTAYIELEGMAGSVRTAGVDNIPGLLQVESYIREQQLMLGMRDAAEVDLHIQTRMRRKQRLYAKGDQLHLCAIITAGTLDRCPRNQIEHLIEQSELSNVDLRILPGDSGPHWLTSMYVIMDFPDNNLPDILYLESFQGGIFMEEQELVSRARQHHDRLLSVVPSKEDSRKLLKSAIQ